MIGTIKTIGSEIAFLRLLKAARRLAGQFYPNKRLADGDRFESNLRELLANTSGSVRASVVGGIFAMQSPAVFERVVGSTDARMALLSMLGRSVIPLLLDHPEINRQLGYDLEPRAPKVRRETPALRRSPNFYEYGLPAFRRDGIEVLVVGSGPGGGAVAASLLRRRPNLRLVLLEAGKYFSDQQLSRLSTTQALVETYEQAGFTTAFDINWGNFSALSVPRGKVVGGTQLVNSTTAEIPPEDVIRAMMDRARFFEFYNVLHKDLAISLAGREVIGESNLAFLVAAEKLGYWGRALFGNRGEDCQGVGRCPSGCPVGAKRTTANTYLPEILSHPNTATAANSKAVRILWGSDGRAAGVEVVSMTGTYRLNLKDQGKNGIVILSGGTIGTPDLLFRSGYDHAGLGQGMTIHPVTETFSLDPEHKHFAFRGLPQGIMVRMGNGMAEGAFPDPGVTGLIAVGLKGKGLKDYMALYPHLRIMGGMIEDGARSGGHLKHWRGETFMFYRMSAEDREKLKLLAVEMLRVWAQDKDSKYLRLPVWPFFPSKIDPYYARLGFFGRDEINAFAAFLRDPRIYLMTFAFHPLGTTRQVIEDGETGKLRGIPNVFVADGSALPMTRKNPQVAIGVSALSKGDRLAEKGKIKYA